MTTTGLNLAPFRPDPVSPPSELKLNLQRLQSTSRNPKPQGLTLFFLSFPIGKLPDTPRVSNTIGLLSGAGLVATGSVLTETPLAPVGVYLDLQGAAQFSTAAANLLALRTGTPPDELFDNSGLFSLTNAVVNVSMDRDAHQDATVFKYIDIASTMALTGIPGIEKTNLLKIPSFSESVGIPALTKVETGFGVLSTMDSLLPRGNDSQANSLPTVNTIPVVNTNVAFSVTLPTFSVNDPKDQPMGSLQDIYNRAVARAEYNYVPANRVENNWDKSIDVRQSSAGDDEMAATMAILANWEKHSRPK